MAEEKDNKNFLRYGENISILNKEIDRVCRNSGRRPEDITVIAATKYVGPEGVRMVHKLGITDFGENRSDELLIKQKVLPEDSRWHFIGHLQSRKAKTVVPYVEYIHSIDSLSTMEKVGKEAGKTGKTQKVLIEVNISGEQTKYGLRKDLVDSFIGNAINIKNIEIKGFMTMAPYNEDIERIRRIFRELRLLKEKVSVSYRGLDLSELSMGMSNDFKIAIEEGATMIRVGSNIFK
ncbi:MAG: YggS family pyridoxal phosphate-dependent enzyme [Actinobacteria bacterium]|nr:YggS family pyridoxal phosphate-dependent enzyme [Actinomycetota bacterium]